MAKTLRDNRIVNPYYETMHNFFNRQVTLVGNYYFLSKSIKTDVGFLGSHMLANHPRTSETIFFQNSFQIDESNKEEKLEYLINYFKLSIIAQTFEAFESFIKDVYRKNLGLHIKNQAVLDITTKNVRGLKNADVLRLLKAICPSLDQIFDKENSSWIQKMEVLRHCIVHSDQLITKEKVKEIRCEFINGYFSFDEQHNSSDCRIKVLGDSPKRILNAFQGLAFSTFVLVCENENYPVEID